MSAGNITPVTFDAQNPLIPAEAHRAAWLISGVVNAQLRITGEQGGDLGAYVFRAQGDTLYLLLPLKSAQSVPPLSGGQAPEALDIEKTLTVSATPTQAEVTAIRDYARAVARQLKAHVDILRTNKFPR